MTEKPDTPEGLRVSAFAPLRHRDFNVLLLGRLVSLVGTQMQIVAIAWQVWQLTGDPLALGGIGLAKILPVTLVALAGGLLADAFDRRSLMTVAALAGSLNSAVLALATYQGWVSLPLLYTCAAVGGAVTAVDSPARQALLPSLVPTKILGQALSMGNAGFQLAAVIGPAVGGIVLAHSGAGMVHLVDSVSYLGMVGGLVLIRHRAAPTGVRLGLAAIREGIDFVRKTPVIRSAMTLDFFAMLFGGSMQLLPIFADRLFRVGPEGLGILFAASAVGAAVTAVVLSLFPTPRAQGAWILAGVAVYGVAIFGFGLTRVFWVGVALLAISGAADTLQAILRATLRQVVTPDALRGRMGSINMVFFIGGPQLGEMEAGLAARLVGVRAAVWTGGLAAALLAGLYAWRAPWLRRYRSR